MCRVGGTVCRVRVGDTVGRVGGRVGKLEVRQSAGLRVRWVASEVTCVGLKAGWIDRRYGGSDWR